MADMMKDLEKFKSKQMTSGIPVDTVFNTGLAAQGEADKFYESDGPLSMKEWDAHRKTLRKAHEWREFIQNGCIEPGE